MRTKTLALSALLGMLGSASVMAQNVYSINAVGYINVTLPAGFSIVSCPLICSPDNTINTLFPNTAAPTYANATVYQFTGGTYTSIQNANPGGSYGVGWTGGGTITLNPGQAVFFNNPGPGNMTATFTGTVPTGTLNNVLGKGYNLVGSMVPVSGDLVASTIANFTFAKNQDFVDFYNPHGQPGTVGFEPEDIFSSGSYGNGWAASGGANEYITVVAGNDHPTLPSPTVGFFYNNAQSSSETWTETFSVN
jgi:hypothetical protein